jgi:hypothetical protein
MPDRLPGTVFTAYHDLLDRHARRPRPEIEGSPLRVVRGGSAYWVTRRRAGAKVVETYLGPDTPELQTRVATAKRDHETLKSWKRDCAQLVSVLRAARCLAPDALVGRALARLADIGLFARGGLLGGTHAFRLYPLDLGLHPPSERAFTDDLELVVPLGLKLFDARGDSLAEALRAGGLALEPVLTTAHADPFRWLVEGKSTLDVLAPVSRQGEGVHPHPTLGIATQMLPFLEFALVDPVEAVALYREGAAIRMPRPERFALHKLIVADLRRGRERGKARKDLQQADWLIDALAEERPYDLAHAWRDLRARSGLAPARRCQPAHPARSGRPPRSGRGGVLRGLRGGGSPGRPYPSIFRPSSASRMRCGMASTGRRVVRSTKTCTNQPVAAGVSAPSLNRPIRYLTERAPSRPTDSPASTVSGNENESRKLQWVSGVMPTMPSAAWMSSPPRSIRYVFMTVSK